MKLNFVSRLEKNNPHMPIMELLDAIVALEHIELGEVILIHSWDYHIEGDFGYLAHINVIDEEYSYKGALEGLKAHLKEYYSDYPICNLLSFTRRKNASTGKMDILLIYGVDDDSERYLSLDEFADELEGYKMFVSNNMDALTSQILSGRCKINYEYQDID